MNTNKRFRISWQEIKLFFQNFNLFPSIPPSNDEYQLRNQRISTRLFIILLTLSCGILLLYTSLVNITQTINIKSPTITQYSQLYSKYPQTLTCPCTAISIDYDTFLYVQYTFHQVCTSVFVTNYWTDYLSTSNGGKSVYTDDFRGSGTFAFQALSTFCELVNQTISNRLSQFYSSQYVSASVVPLQVFQSQTQSSISQFILSTTNDFLLSLSTIRNTTQSNALFSGEQTSYGIDTPKGNINAYSYVVWYGNCSCASSVMCAYQFPIYSDSGDTTLFLVPGIYTGCYAIESLLQSNLQCFYNQTCINTLQTYLTSSSPVTVTALDKSLLVRFLENSTIEGLINQLMIEEWNASIMYESYYNECQPSQCTYIHQTKNDAIYIVTTLVGLIGGLTTALKLIVPRLVKYVAFCIRKWTMKRTRIMSMIQT